MLLVFSHLFGYEYAVIARLYGWGSFFLWMGIENDLQKKHKKAALFLGLACLTQLNFVFAAFAWCISQLFSNSQNFSMKRLVSDALYKYGILLLSMILVILHFEYASQDRAWSSPHFEFSGSKVGNTLINLSAPLKGRLGWIGFVVFSFALFSLKNSRHRLSWILGIAPFVYLFSFHNPGGEAAARHGGPLFLVFVAFSCLELPSKTLRYLLALSCLSGIIARAHDIFSPYSDGKKIAQVILKDQTDSSQKFEIIAQDQRFGFVIAAYLNKDFWTGFDFKRVQYPSFTRTSVSSQFNPPGRISWEKIYDFCSELDNDKSKACYIIARSGDDAPLPLPDTLCAKELVPLETSFFKTAVTDERFKLMKIWPKQDHCAQL